MTYPCPTDLDDWAVFADWLQARREDHCLYYRKLGEVLALCLAGRYPEFSTPPTQKELLILIGAKPFSRRRHRMRTEAMQKQVGNPGFGGDRYQTYTMPVLVLERALIRSGVQQITRCYHITPRKLSRTKMEVILNGIDPWARQRQLWPPGHDLS